MHRNTPLVFNPHNLNGMALAILTLLLAVAFPVQASSRGKAPWVGESFSKQPCRGGDAKNYGPFDYRTDKDKLPLVENYHFTPEVEQLRKGSTASYAIGDVTYTLLKFPNHHRALYSAVRFSLGDWPKQVKQEFPPAECFLQRAIYFTPNDYVPYMLYGIYLHRLGKLDESLTFYRHAEELAPRDANLQYNIGLVLFDAGNYTESYRYATKAYAGGMTQPGLRRKLEGAGHWGE